MDPAEQQLFRREEKRRVKEFDITVACLIASDSSKHNELLRRISELQLWLKERPWVSHFVPHLTVVRKRLNDFLQSTSVTPAPQPAPPFNIGVMHLQPACSKPDPPKDYGPAELLRLPG